MKKQLLFCLMMVPTLLFAQDDNKYLVGAVPMKDEKVVFTKKVSVPSETKEQVYNVMNQWAQEKFNTETSRVVYADQDEGDLAVVAEKRFVFKSNFIALDQTDMSYRMTIECEDGQVDVEISGIKYKYVVAYQDKPEVYLAEEWITDDYALNRSKTKLNRVSGKFRQKTIDYVDSLFMEIEDVLNAPSTTVAPSQNQLAKADLKERPGYTLYTVDRIPMALQKMLPLSAIQITSLKGNDKYENVVWKSFGKVEGKQIANVKCSTAGDIKPGTVYSISFSDKETNEVWMIVECSKMDIDMGDPEVLFGEVLNVWVK